MNLKGNFFSTKLDSKKLLRKYKKINLRININTLAMDKNISYNFNEHLNKNVLGNKNFFWNQCFDKSRLKNFVAWFLVNYGEHKTLELVEQLKTLGFKYATKAGISLGIDDLKIPPKKAQLIFQAEKITSFTIKQYKRGEITGVERFQRLIDSWHRTSESLKQEVIDYFENTDILNPVYMMAFSGARGNISQVRQLVGMRGLMANPQGQIIDYPIRSNFREGLTLTEYIISSYGARKGIVDTALRTANAGYLTRRLVDVAQHVIISNFDCKTNGGIFLSDMKEGNKIIYSLSNRLVGRVLARDIYASNSFEKNANSNSEIAKKNTEISLDLSFEIAKISKKVFVRSVLGCNNKKLVCQLCYGWSLAQGNLVSIGEAVGVIAAQSIGEPGTQLTMRTFHTGGVFSGGVTDQIKAPFDGFIEYGGPIPGKLVRTPEGKIGFLTINEGSFIIYSSAISKGVNMDLSDKKNQISSPLKGSPSPNKVWGTLHSSAMLGARRFTKLGFEEKFKDLKNQTKKYKTPVYTLLFKRMGESVFSKEVIAQISSLSKQKNATDDAELTIKSDIEGQFNSNGLLINRILVGPNLKEEERDNQIPFDPLFQAFNWGDSWILSGKIYKLPLASCFFPFVGDFINRKTIMNQIKWKFHYENFYNAYSLELYPCFIENPYNSTDYLNKISFHNILKNNNNIQNQIKSPIDKKTIINKSLDKVKAKNKINFLKTKNLISSYLKNKNLFSNTNATFYEIENAITKKKNLSEFINFSKDKIALKDLEIGKNLNEYNEKGLINVPIIKHSLLALNVKNILYKKYGYLVQITSGLNPYLILKQRFSAATFYLNFVKVSKKSSIANSASGQKISKNLIEKNFSKFNEFQKPKSKFFLHQSLFSVNSNRGIEKCNIIGKEDILLLVSPLKKLENANNSNFEKEFSKNSNVQFACNDVSYYKTKSQLKKIKRKSNSSRIYLSTKKLNPFFTFSSCFSPTNWIKNFKFFLNWYPANFQMHTPALVSLEKISVSPLQLRDPSFAGNYCTPPVLRKFGLLVTPQKTPAKQALIRSSKDTQKTPAKEALIRSSKDIQKTLAKQGLRAEGFWSASPMLGQTKKQQLIDKGNLAARTLNWSLQSLVIQRNIDLLPSNSSFNRTFNHVIKSNFNYNFASQNFRKRDPNSSHSQTSMKGAFNKAKGIAPSYARSKILHSSAMLGKTLRSSDMLGWTKAQQHLNLFKVLQDKFLFKDKNFYLNITPKGFIKILSLNKERKYKFQLNSIFKTRQIKQPFLTYEKAFLHSQISMLAKSNFAESRSLRSGELQSLDDKPRQVALGKATGIAPSGGKTLHSSAMLGWFETNSFNNSQKIKSCNSNKLFSSFIKKAFIKKIFRQNNPSERYIFKKEKNKSHLISSKTKKNQSLILSNVQIYNYGDGRNNHFQNLDLTKSNQNLDSINFNRRWKNSYNYTNAKVNTFVNKIKKTTHQENLGNIKGNQSKKSNSKQLLSKNISLNKEKKKLILDPVKLIREMNTANFSRNKAIPNQKFNLNLIKGYTKLQSKQSLSALSLTYSSFARIFFIPQLFYQLNSTFSVLLNENKIFSSSNEKPFCYQINRQGFVKFCYLFYPTPITPDSQNSQKDSKLNKNLTKKLKLTFKRESFSVQTKTQSNFPLFSSISYCIGPGLLKLRLSNSQFFRKKKTTNSRKFKKIRKTGQLFLIPRSLPLQSKGKQLGVQKQGLRAGGSQLKARSLKKRNITKKKQYNKKTKFGFCQFLPLTRKTKNQRSLAMLGQSKIHLKKYLDSYKEKKRQNSYYSDFLIKIIKKFIFSRNLIKTEYLLKQSLSDNKVSLRDNSFVKSLKISIPSFNNQKLNKTKKIIKSKLDIKIDNHFLQNLSKKINLQPPVNVWNSDKIKVRDLNDRLLNLTKEKLILNLNKFNKNVQKKNFTNQNLKSKIIKNGYSYKVTSKIFFGKVKKQKNKSSYKKDKKTLLVSALTSNCFKQTQLKTYGSQANSFKKNENLINLSRLLYFFSSISLNLKSFSKKIIYILILKNKLNISLHLHRSAILISFNSKLIKLKDNLIKNSQQMKKKKLVKLNPNNNSIFDFCVLSCIKMQSEKICKTFNLQFKKSYFKKTKFNNYKILKFYLKSLSLSNILSKFIKFELKKIAPFILINKDNSINNTLINKVTQAELCSAWAKAQSEQSSAWAKAQSELGSPSTALLCLGIDEVNNNNLKYLTTNKNKFNFELKNSFIKNKLLCSKKDIFKISNNISLKNKKFTSIIRQILKQDSGLKKKTLFLNFSKKKKISLKIKDNFYIKSNHKDKAERDSSNKITTKTSKITNHKDKAGKSSSNKVTTKTSKITNHKDKAGKGSSNKVTTKTSKITQKKLVGRKSWKPEITRANLDKVKSSNSLKENLIGHSLYLEKLSLQIKFGWIYFPNNLNLDTKDNKKYFFPGQIFLGNLIFDNHICYLEFISLDKLEKNFNLTKNKNLKICNKEFISLDSRINSSTQNQNFCYKYIINHPILIKTKSKSNLGNSKIDSPSQIINKNLKNTINKNKMFKKSLCLKQSCDWKWITNKKARYMPSISSLTNYKNNKKFVILIRKVSEYKQPNLSSYKNQVYNSLNNSFIRTLSPLNYKNNKKIEFKLNPYRLYNNGNRQSPSLLSQPIPTMQSPSLAKLCRANPNSVWVNKHKDKIKLGEITRVHKIKTWKTYSIPLQMNKNKFTYRRTIKNNLNKISLNRELLYKIELQKLFKTSFIFKGFQFGKQIKKNFKLKLLTILNNSFCGITYNSNIANFLKLKYVTKQSIENKLNYKIKSLPFAEGNIINNIALKSFNISPFCTRIIKIPQISLQFNLHSIDKKLSLFFNKKYFFNKSYNSSNLIQEFKNSLINKQKITIQTISKFPNIDLKILSNLKFYYNSKTYVSSPSPQLGRPSKAGSPLSRSAIKGWGASSGNFVEPASLYKAEATNLSNTLNSKIVNSSILNKKKQVKLELPSVKKVNQSRKNLVSLNSNFSANGNSNISSLLTNNKSYLTQPIFYRKPIIHSLFMSYEISYGLRGIFDKNVFFFNYKNICLTFNLQKFNNSFHLNNILENYIRKLFKQQNKNFTLPSFSEHSQTSMVTKLYSKISEVPSQLKYNKYLAIGMPNLSNEDLITNSKLTEIDSNFSNIFKKNINQDKQNLIAKFLKNETIFLHKNQTPKKKEILSLIPIIFNCPYFSYNFIQKIDNRFMLDNNFLNILSKLDFKNQNNFSLIPKKVEIQNQFFTSLHNKFHSSNILGITSSYSAFEGEIIYKNDTRSINEYLKKKLAFNFKSNFLKQQLFEKREKKIPVLNQNSTLILTKQDLISVSLNQKVTQIKFGVDPSIARGKTLHSSSMLGLEVGVNSWGATLDSFAILGPQLGARNWGLLVTPQNILQPCDTNVSKVRNRGAQLEGQKQGLRVERNLVLDVSLDSSPLEGTQAEQSSAWAKGATSSNSSSMLGPDELINDLKTSWAFAQAEQSSENRLKYLQNKFPSIANQNLTNGGSITRLNLLSLPARLKLIQTWKNKPKDLMLKKSTLNDQINLISQKSLDLLTKYHIKNILQEFENQYIRKTVYYLNDIFFKYKKITRVRKTCAYSSGVYTLNKMIIGLPISKTRLSLGEFFKYGDKLKNNLTILQTGQIVHLSREKMTLRQGQRIKISINAILHKKHQELVKSQSAVLTLSYSQLKTGDIVQGIPKIEQFFEARTSKRGRLFRDSLPNLLESLFRYYQSYFSIDKAARQSLYKIQEILIDGVQRVYRGQGVTISDKHLEIIVKQMTSKARILKAGSTGYFPGDIEDLFFIEKIYQSCPTGIEYEPLILGISKTSLEVKSFLSAASFQHTTRVLTKAALNREKDYLSGLKENILLGNLIPSGIGYLVSLESKIRN